jgi:hypothetical protein
MVVDLVHCRVKFLFQKGGALLGGAEGGRFDTGYVVETLVEGLQQLAVAFARGPGQVGGERGNTFNAVVSDVRFPTGRVVARLIVDVLLSRIEDIKTLESRLRNSRGCRLRSHIGVNIRRGSAEPLFRAATASRRLSGGGTR